MRYELKHTLTLSGVGCFAAHPGPNLSFNEMLAHLRECPMDGFMHRFVLDGLAGHRTRKVEKFIQAGLEADPVLESLILEACLVHDRFAALKPLMAHADPEKASAHSPLVHLRALTRPDQKLHNAWNALFSANIHEHAPLPAPGEAGLQPLPEQDRAIPFADQPATAAEVREALADRLPAPRKRCGLMDTIRKAGTALDSQGCLAGPEMRHKACLGEVAVLRHWMVDIRTASGRQSLSLSGLQTSYGRGFNELQARASLLMEIAERVSSFGNFRKNEVSGLNRPAPLTFGRYGDLGVPALDPSTLRLETPYDGRPLWWMPGHAPDGKGGTTEVLVPPQLAYLFCNLDEPDLTSGVGSTGLASGNTLAEAKVSALCEALERDAEATVPFSPDRLFRPESDDPDTSRLLAKLRDGGIHVLFLDITNEFGIPCYKAFVLGDKHGDVNRGTGASLCGFRAAVSAMTEIPYPFPGPPTRPVPEDIPSRRLEDLPDLSTGGADGDLMVLEETLARNGFNPVYVELTRKDLDIPVVRALVPGLEFMADMDRFARVSPRLYGRYLRMFEG